MDWLLRSLAKVFVTVLDDLMGWSTNIVADFKLTIGYNPNDPVWTAITDPTSVHDSVFEKTFPMAASFTTIFVVMGMSIVIFFTALKLFQAIGGPFTKSEDPIQIAGRFLLAGIGVVWSYSIFVVFERFFNQFYMMCWNKYQGIASNANNHTAWQNINQAKNNAINDAITSGGSGEKQVILNGITTADGKTISFWGNIVKDASTMESLGILILEILIGIFLIWNFIKLVLEMYERYVMIGVLFYTAPLPFATLITKDSTVFGSWFKMVISEFILMCLNLLFLGTFVGAWNNLLGVAAKQGYVFESMHEFVTTMFLLTAWLIVGQKADQYLKNLGLSTAQTGESLGGALLSTAMLAGNGARAVGSALGAAGKIASGTDAVSKMRNSNGAAGRLSRTIAPEREGGRFAANSMLSQRQGKEDLANKLGHVTGERAVNAATRGAGIDLSRTGLGPLNTSKCTAGGGHGHLEDINGRTLDYKPQGQSFSDKDGNTFATKSVPGTHGSYITPLTTSDVESWKSNTKTNLVHKFNDKEYSIVDEGNDIVVQSKNGYFSQKYTMPELEGKGSNGKPLKILK